MKNDQYIFLVVENAPDVCEGIIRRMSVYKKWKPIEYAVSVKQAIQAINHHHPHLLFLDWSLAGGSAFEVMQAIDNIIDYNPYIIFNTGYQKDNPDIPQEIINHYRVDKYLIKPFWETLRLHLPEYLSEAEKKAELVVDEKKNKIWLKADNQGIIPVDLKRLICICQDPMEPRNRVFTFDDNQKEIIVHMQWQKCIDLLRQYEIDFFVTKTRGHLVCRNYIEVFQKPFVRLKNFPAKIEVVKESIKQFEDWLFSNTGR